MAYDTVRYENDLFQYISCLGSMNKVEEKAVEEWSFNTSHV